MHIAHVIIRLTHYTANTAEPLKTTYCDNIDKLKNYNSKQ